MKKKWISFFVFMVLAVVQPAVGQKSVDDDSDQIPKSLESYKAELVAYKGESLATIRDRIEKLNENAKTLGQIDRKIKKSPKSISLEDLNLVTRIWRRNVDEAISNLFKSDTEILEDVPTLPSEFSNSDEREGVDEKTLSTVQSLKELRETVEDELLTLKRKERDLQSRALLNAGRVRAATMNTLIDRGTYSVWGFDRDILKDYAREVQVVPYRVLAILSEKYFDVKKMGQEGIRGWFQIVKHLFVLFIVLLLPFFLIRIFEKFSTFLENYRKQIFTRSQMDFKQKAKVAFWIGRINPYLSWIFAYLTIKISYSLLIGTLLEPLSVFLPYLNIYVLYRIFRIFFGSVLSQVLLSRNLNKVRTKQPKVQATARELSILFFAQWAFLHATEDIVRQALIYNLVFDSILSVNFLIIAFESRKWREELLSLSEQWLLSKFQQRIKNLSNLPLELIVYPILFLGNVGFLFVGWVYQWLSRFEIGKKITSEIFKKRLEEASEGVDNHNADVGVTYVEVFSDLENSNDIEINLSRNPKEKSYKFIEQWKEGTSHDDLLLIYGNYGIGKSTLLNSISTHFGDSLQVKRVDLKKKIISIKNFYETLSSVFELKIESIQDFEKMDRSIDKTLLVFDDIHNLYLNTTQGLEVYRALIELTSLQLENIFWCLSCDEKALNHLNGIFGNNHFLGEKVEVLSWMDSEIQDLILSRHKKSGRKIKFDNVISAVHKGDILESSSGLEVQFFRLLWGQSKGNPKTAQELWLSAASIDSRGVIQITVPEFTNPRVLGNLSDEALMIYAALVKHENLTFPELVSVCDLPQSLMKQALKFGEDSMLLQKINRFRWKIHPKSQYVVYSFLSGRNLIYG